MTYDCAVKLLNAQDRNVRKINGIRFIRGKYEYRITYRGGFACYVAIDRREIGRRNYKYFSGVGAYNCWDAEDAMKLVMDEIIKKES